MPPKRTHEGGSATVKKRHSISMEVKVDIIKRPEKGESPTAIGKALGFSRSTIATIVKDKKKIMDHVKSSTAMQSTIISKKRSALIMEMERLLVIWLDDQHHRNVPVSLSLVQEKARCLFSDLKAARAASDGDSDETFSASKG